MELISKKPLYRNSIEDIFMGDGFEMAMSIDCEGTNYDKNLENNVKNLERFLQKATDNDITTILFITPYFADMLHKLDLVDKIKYKYKVIFGLHIHPDNFPSDIALQCPFIRPDEEYFASYSYEEQKKMLSLSMKYLQERGVTPIQIFRGGCFSMNTDTANILLEITDIRYESHNPFREQYDVEKGLLNSIPVYALNRDEEIRLEFFTTEKLEAMLSDAIMNNSKVMGITHSYMLDPNDFHYERDGIKDDIHQRLDRLINVVENHKIHKVK